MPVDFDVNVPATTSGLEAALQSLDAFCDACRLRTDAARRARIVIEELFTNTIKYGYGGECARPVRLTGRVEAKLLLFFEDEAPPFDLTLWRAPSPISGERVGQQGIAMVMGLCESVGYARVAGANRISIVIG